MRPGHLARRFFGACSRREPAPDDVAWVRSVCTPAEFDHWSRLPAHDRRHAVAVGRSVAAALADGSEPADPRWIEAALLHDVGKLDAGLGVPGRVVATLVMAVVGARRVAGWSGRSGWRGRLGAYADHPGRGADRIRTAGGSTEAAAWAAVHQDPSRRDACGLPAPVVAALVAADDD